MVDKDVIFEKVKHIQACLKRIQSKTQGNPESLDDIDVEDIFTLNLQRAIQSSIDLAAHVIADEGLGLPNILKENFEILKTEKIISKELCVQLQHMVGFRNIAVHEYHSIDKAILKSILKKDLKSLELFYTSLLKHFKL
jgi:uncharacterized protein YutE (UPF0331/DUF86 family)